MPFFQNAQNVNASYSYFNDIAGTGPFNYVQVPAPSGRTENKEEKTEHYVIEFDGQIEGWDVCIHPDGYRYFYCKGTDTVTLDGHFVKTNPFNGSVATAVAEEKLERAVGPLDSDTMFVNHALWYASKIESEVLQRDQEPSKIYKLQLEYWTFMYSFPAHRQLPDGAEEAARQALNCYQMEGLRRRSETSAPFTLGESQEILSYMDYYDEWRSKDTNPVPSTASVPSRSTAKTALVAWVLSNAAKHREQITYGQVTKSEKDSLLRDAAGLSFDVISFFFFGAPISHLQHIKVAQRAAKLRGDVETWPRYIQNLIDEWSTFNIAATVLLSASISLLTIPGIDPVTRFISLLSIVSTLGSIMSGVFLLWRHQAGRVKLEYNISEVITPFQSSTLAVILSIPFVTLTWGVIGFLVAVIIYAFLGVETLTDGNIQHISRPTSYTVLAASAALSIIIGISFIFFRLFRSRSAS